MKKAVKQKNRDCDRTVTAGGMIISRVRALRGVSMPAWYDVSRWTLVGRVPLGYRPVCAHLDAGRGGSAYIVRRHNNTITHTVARALATCVMQVAGMRPTATTLFRVTLSEGLFIVYAKGV